MYAFSTCLLQCPADEAGAEHNIFRLLKPLQFASTMKVKAVLAHLRPDEPLYPSALDSYRRRWDRLLLTLDVPASARLTPGCVGGGGAVHLYHVGGPIANIPWVMRPKVLQTLEHYLPETAALGVLHKPPPHTKSKVFSCAKLLPFVSRLFTSDVVL